MAAAYDVDAAGSDEGQPAASKQLTHYIDQTRNVLGVPVTTGWFRWDKRGGLGEDATPVTVAAPSNVVLAVFDGLGGSGAETYQRAATALTGAALGAQTAAMATREHAQRTQGAVTLEGLKEAISNSLRDELAEVAGERSALKGKLLRKLPTTVAVLRISPVQDRGIARCTAFWAGDSRLYVLDAWGLHQLSADHLVAPNDPMQNLLQDSELSNCARADDEFYLESRDVELTVGGFLAMAASDGFFGYFPTPMHVEHMLLEAIFEAQGFEDWQSNVIQRVTKVAQDDVSFAFAAVGWENFQQLRSAFRECATKAEQRIRPLDAAATRVSQAETDAAAAATALDDLRSKTWTAFRRLYEYRGPITRG